ncbi:MAG: hypothetical protein Greene041679_229 [Parcubacteria group bacterium Greene0416_79]|nr:MAG: hypothetical protein Greene041679_229 [Parcubacteria group bacterium Greene0416_79]
MSSESLSLAALIPTLLLAGTLLAFLVMSAVLLYHWRRYGMKSGAIHLAKGVYFLVSAFLVVLAVSLYLLLI